MSCPISTLECHLAQAADGGIAGVRSAASRLIGSRRRRPFPTDRRQIQLLEQVGCVVTDRPDHDSIRGAIDSSSTITTSPSRSGARCRTIQPSAMDGRRPAPGDRFIGAKGRVEGLRLIADRHRLALRHRSRGPRSGSSHHRLPACRRSALDAQLGRSRPARVAGPSPMSSPLLDDLRVVDLTDSSGEAGRCKRSPTSAPR